MLAGRVEKKAATTATQLQKSPKKEKNNHTAWQQLGPNLQVVAALLQLCILPSPLIVLRLQCS